MTPQPVYCRPSHARAIFGISRATIYRWAAAGHITLHKRGAATFVKVAEVAAYIERGDSARPLGG